jgi:molybdopterin-containing oxidoreductase family iron-sulfur binding subunit
VPFGGRRQRRNRKRPATADSGAHSRRDFLTLMGASVGLAGLGGCIRMPEEKLAPYARRPVGRSPGVPVTYATAMEIGGVAQGLLVTCVDGRPVKIEGNPLHPLNQGATDAIAQASILDLYDPDRSRGVIRRVNGERTESSWEEFARWAKGVFKGGRGQVCVLSGVSGSPSLAGMRQRLDKATGGTVWLDCGPLDYDGTEWVTELSRAKVIVALDADLFGGGDPLAIKYARDFAAARVGTASRLYVVEPAFTITGACADHRRPVRAGLIGAVAAQLARALDVDNDGKEVASGVDASFVRRVAADLKANPGRSVVVAGPRQPPGVRDLAAAINQRLGNIGKTIVHYPVFVADRHVSGSPLAGFGACLEDLCRHGGVNALVILGGNPVYSAPPGFRLAKAIQEIPNTIHLSLYEDETSQLCQWHLSEAHYLEAWGDARTYDGTLSVAQPTIEPLFDGRSAIEALALLTGDQAGIDGGGYEIVRRTCRELLGREFSEWNWKKWLADGLVAGTAWKLGNSVVDYMSIEEPGLTKEPEGLDLVFFTDPKVYDGRFANNGWLQEMPDPMTRLTWGNAALISPGTAERLGVESDDVVALEADGVEVRVPVLIQPGTADGVIGLALGYGRTAAGSVGNGVGQNAYLLRTSENMGWRSGVKVRPTGEKYKLATVQDHHVIDRVGKEAIRVRVPELVHEVTLEQLRAKPQAADRPARSIYDEHPMSGGVAGEVDPAGMPKHDRHRWGMAIDLSACTGCGACVVACQAENNIPIVGKEQVLHGREMHWIRVDRYFVEPSPPGTRLRVPIPKGEGRQSPATSHSPLAAVRSVHQPVPCMQCENAPCEEVCPFGATTHSQEGLNMMTYNRCVGTRYCSNNCPYKVRRFNFFDYNCGTLKDLYVPNLLRRPISELLRMQKNPDVTVRMRGVMEKCTYCIQRIEAARIAAKREGDRPIADGEIRTACQQVCPARAIVFGDLNDKKSRVSQVQALGRSYGLLDRELNTKPRTRYLARVRNPAPGLDAELYAGEEEREG